MSEPNSTVPFKRLSRGGPTRTNMVSSKHLPASARSRSRGKRAWDRRRLCGSRRILVSDLRARVGLRPLGLFALPRFATTFP